MSKRTLIGAMLLAALVLGLSVSFVDAQEVNLRWRTRPDNQAEIDLYQSISDSIDKVWDGVTLKYEPGGSEGADYQTSLLTELAAGTAPDVFWIPGASTATFAKSGVIMNLDQMVKDNSFDMNVFYPQQVEQLTFNPDTGKNEDAVWGFPRDASAFVLYYNKDLFDEAGVDYPDKQLKNGKWDWDAFKKTSEAIHSLGSDTLGFGMNAWWANWWMWVNMAGGSYFNADRTACALNTPEVATALNYLAGMYKEGIGVPYGTDSEPPFVAGKVGMFLNGRWATPNNLKSLKFKWDAAEVPAGPKGQSNWLFWGAYVMNAKTTHPKEAFELMTKLVSLDVQAQITKLGANIPSRKGDDAVKAFLDSTPDINNQAWVNSLKYAVAEAPLWGANFDELDGKVVEPAVAKVLNGDMAAEDFTKTICDQVDPFFKKS
jgi:multiple sugar transport system substrate-binding protein